MRKMSRREQKQHCGTVPSPSDSNRTSAREIKSVREPLTNFLKLRIPNISKEEVPRQRVPHYSQGKVADRSMAIRYESLD